MASKVFHFPGLLLVFSLAFLSCYASPTALKITAPTVELTRRAVVAPGIELRIMPLGDSITNGYKSSKGDGYRIQLQNHLSGSRLQYVGSVQSGSMANNDNEGHSGATIKQIARYAKKSLHKRPNIVLLHAGTNDLNNDPPTDPYRSAPDRLGALIDQIVRACPDAVVLVAQLINNAHAKTEARIKTFNSHVPGVVAQRVKAGHRVMVVNMAPVPVNDLADGIHPIDAGYNIMGDIWFAALQAADKKGWIRPPIGSDL